MKIGKNFPVQVVGVLCVASLVAAYPLAHYGSRETVIAAVVGALLSTVNVLAGFLTIEYSFDKSHTTFLKAVLGGMGVRMAVLLGALIFSIKVVELEVVPLTITLLSFYLVYLGMEILYLQKKVATKNQI